MRGDERGWEGEWGREGERVRGVERGERGVKRGTADRIGSCMRELDVQEEMNNGLLCCFYEGS